MRVFAPRSAQAFSTRNARFFFFFSGHFFPLTKLSQFAWQANKRQEGQCRNKGRELGALGVFLMSLLLLLCRRLLVTTAKAKALGRPEERFSTASILWCGRNILGLET